MKVMEKPRAKHRIFKNKIHKNLEIIAITQNFEKETY